MDDPISRLIQTCAVLGGSGFTMSKDDSLYDLAIVGASFAGLVAARTAAMRGLKVVVLEVKPDPGASRCDHRHSGEGSR